MTRAQLMEALKVHGPISAPDLAELLNLNASTLRSAIVKTRRALPGGAIRIAEWARQMHPHRGRPTPMFVASPGEDAPQPKKVPKRVKDAGYRARWGHVIAARNRAKRGAAPEAIATWIPHGIF